MDMSDGGQGVMQLLRPLLLDTVPTVQQTAALALGRLANSNDELAAQVIEPYLCKHGRVDSIAGGDRRRVASTRDRSCRYRQALKKSSFVCYPHSLKTLPRPCSGTSPLHVLVAYGVKGCG